MTPIARGVLLALAAALSFGAMTPLVQRWGAGAGPSAVAALLYLGAAGFAAITPGSSSDARLDRSWMPRVGLVGLSGAFVAPVAPVALAAGLARTHGTTASLLLNLEAVFTVLLGAAVHHEPVGRRVWTALGLIFAGGVAVALDGEGDGATTWLGPALIALATLAWAVDNTLSRPLSDLRPADVVRAKGAVGAAASITLALATGAVWPAPRPALGVLLCGAIGFGGSLRLYLMAQRVLGAARTGSVFAVAPFLGVVGARLLGEPLGGWLTALGGAAMAAGVWLHLGEDHDHEHHHEALVHTHPHRHDDGHHDHAHELPVVGEHSHAHAHAPLTHRHPHGEDLHHRHTHG